jgi:hypothetical protein
MNQSQRRATALTKDQINYIKGCARLQLAIWRLCHRDPLNALSDRNSLLILRRAILTLKDTRERLRKQYLRSYMQKWLKNSQMMTLSNARRQALLRARVNRLEALKRFLLSQALKNWRIKAARSVEDFLSRFGNFMRLMEAGARRKTKQSKKEFFQNTKKTIAPEYYHKPLKSCINLYDRCQKLLKFRAFNAWKNKVLNMNNQLAKRQLLLKNIVKPMVANNTAILRNTFKKWRQNVLGLRNDYEKLLLLRGHSAYHIYNKWYKTNMLKTLSNAFNDWRRKAAIRPINYKAKMLQAKPHMLKHNINMNAEDLLQGLRSRYIHKLRRDALRKLINKINKQKKLLLSQNVQKWKRIAKYLSGLIKRRDAILRGRVNKNELYTRMLLNHRFNNWRIASAKDDKLSRCGALLRFVDLTVKKCLLQPKVDFMNNLYNYRNTNYYRKPLLKMIALKKKCQDLIKRQANNKWMSNVNLLNNLQKRRNALLRTIFRAKQQNQLYNLKDIVNQWYKTAMRMNNDYENLLYRRGKSIYSLYNKWHKSNLMTTLSNAFNEWRRRAAIKPIDYEKLITQAKPHLLKHNIFKNAEDLLNALRSKYNLVHRQNVLKKVLKKGDKAKDFILRNAFNKWYVNTLKSEKKNNILGKLLINNDFRMNNLVEKLLRKSLYTWLKNASQPKTAIPNTEKACDLIRKATTEPFFTKLRERMQNKMNKDRFKSILALVVRNKDKDLIRWYFGQWRTNTRKLRAYDMNAIFLNQFFKNRGDHEKFRLFQNLRDRANFMNNTQETTTRILTNLFSKLDALNKLNNKERLGRYLYKWKSNCGLMKNPFDLVTPFLEGFKTLENYCLRTTHPDVLKSFNATLILPAQHDHLYRLVKKYNNSNIRDALKNSISIWKNNIKDRGQVKKLKEMFDDYTLLNREKLMAPYKDLCQAIVDFANKRNSKTGVITDFLRGLKDLPNQLKTMKRTHLLLKIMSKGNRGYSERLRSTFVDWIRRARAIKQESCSEVIQKFIRDKLQKRLTVKDKIEKASQHAKVYLWGKILQKIADHANKNVLKDILLKYFNYKDANNMKLLKDKFNKWNSLLPYLRRINASTLIQSWFRGGVVRDEIRRFNRINELLLNIVSRYKNDVGPYFQKWCKNARLLKAEEMDKVIQNFIRNKLSLRVKNKALESLQDLFKKYAFRQVTDVLNKVGKFNPEDYDKFERIIMNAVRRQPYEQLKKGLRWIGILNAIKFAPELYEKFRKMHLRKYLERWLENGYLIPNSAANLIQAVYRGYQLRKLLQEKELIKQILLNIVNMNTTKREDFLRSALLKWYKTTRKMKCADDSNTIREFCRLIREKRLMEVQDKWKYLSHRLLPHQINSLFKLAKINKILDKLYKKRFMEDLYDSAFLKYMKELLISLLSKYDDKTKRELLRNKLQHWAQQKNRMKDYEESMQTVIKQTWANYHREKKKTQ